MSAEQARPALPDAFRRHRRRLASTPLHVCGVALSAVSAGMLACALLELVTTGRDTAALAVAGAATAGVGGLLWYSTKPREVDKRAVFATVGWTWIVTILAGAVPFVLAGTFATAGVGFAEQVVNSIFESASGYSATGATSLTDFDRPGRGMLMYRQATHWYGGMGVVVLAVAVLPFLGVGGLELISAEAPGTSSDRLTPRVSETARRLWLVYIGFTVGAAAVLFAVPGPSAYDAVAHALSAVSTGGFTPYAQSVGVYDSVLVESVVIVIMIIGAVSFTLHWRAVAQRSFSYHRDSEFKSYMTVLTVAAAVIVAVLWLDGGMAFGSAVRAGVFNVVSLGTSTGFSNATGPGSAADYVVWAAGAQVVLLCLMVVGGCSGSTAGGTKVKRMQVLGVLTLRSVRQSQTPRAVIPVRLGRDVIGESVVSRVSGFFLLHFFLVMIGLLVVTSLGGDFETSLGAVVSALSNMGPALGEAGPTSNYSAAFGLPARLVLAALMVVGRLEIVPILLAFVPYFDRARAVTRAVRH